MTKAVRVAASGTVGLALAAPLVAGALGWTVSAVESGQIDVESGYAIGDLVVTAPLHGRDARVGDVVRVRGPRSSGNEAVQKVLEVTGQTDPGFVHRVIELRGRDGSVILTQGDANNASDDPHSRGDLAGRVVARAPKAAGSAWTAFRSVPAQVALAVLCVLLWPTRRTRRSQRTTTAAAPFTPSTPRNEPVQDDALLEPVGQVKRAETCGRRRPDEGWPASHRDDNPRSAAARVTLVSGRHPRYLMSLSLTWRPSTPRRWREFGKELRWSMLTAC